MALFSQDALNPGVRKREVFGWAMYDFANSGYTTVVLTAVFNAYFVSVVAKNEPWATFAWTVALAIQFFHHIEHLLLQTQYLLGHNLFDRPVPTSLLQLWVPRVELHLFYNTIVFVPMVVAMYFHMFPRQSETSVMRCTCAWHNGAAVTV